LVQSCVSPLGGDQFDPGQEETIRTYFAMFYLSTNVGAFITQFVTPMFRSFDCGMDEYNIESCFQLSFWISTFIIFVAWITFFSGTKFYYVKKPSGNLVAKAGSAIWTALKVEQIIMEILFIISIRLKEKHQKANETRTNTGWTMRIQPMEQNSVAI